MDERPSPRVGNLPRREAEFPELEKIRAIDREQHIRQAMESGMSRADAERHADEHLSERADGRP